MTDLFLADIQTNGQPEDSWQPKDLTQLPDKPPVQPDLGHSGIVYPGKRHVFSGPPESAKTLCAYAIGILTIRNGGTIILIDFEMGEYDCRDRLQELGATRDEISQGVHYLEPDQPATQQRIDNLLTLQPQLVIIDAGAGVYDLEDLDDNKRKDVGKIARLYVHPFWRNSIATILIDHVVKNTETRGKFAIGSERKLGGADVHLGFETVRAISRGTSGLYKVITHKDRGGYLKRGHLANLELESAAETHQIEWALLAANEEQDAPFRPTHLMERVSIWLKNNPGEYSRNDINKAIKGDKKALLAAINALVAEGYAAGESPKPVTHARPYREDDPICNPETSQPARVVLCGGSAVDTPGTAGGVGGVLFPEGSTTSPHLSVRATEPEGGLLEPHHWSWLDELAATVDLEQQASTLEDEAP